MPRKKLYADTDFFLALIKSSDWLQENTRKLHRKHKGNIVTSTPTIIELALIAKKYDLDVDTIITAVYQLADVQGITIEQARHAAHLIEQEHVGVFDSFHVSMSEDRPIISSDKIYDKIGKERIALEKKTR